MAHHRAYPTRTLPLLGRERASAGADAVAAQACCYQVGALQSGQAAMVNAARNVQAEIMGTFPTFAPM
jgi:hypothetical protein